MWQYNYAYSPDVLYHYGIKGMKWGVRRTPEELMYDRGSITSTLNRNLKNVKTPNGVVVKTISSHALDKIDSNSDRKVTSNEIADALENPIHIGKKRLDNQGRCSIRYIGNNATVNVNPNNGVITTVWKTGKDKRKKYAK